MARKFLVCSLIVAVFAAASFGQQADTQNIVDTMTKEAEKFLSGIMKQVQDAIKKAQDFIDGVKQKIRQEEDKLLSQVPDPLGGLLKAIVKKIHEAEDNRVKLGANMTECVFHEAQPTFGIIGSIMEGMKSCVDQQTSGLKGTISDFEGLIKQALSLVISAPKDLVPCIQFPPTSQTWACVTGKMQELASKAMMLISSLIGDMGTIGNQVPEIIKNVVNCGVDQRFEAEKKLGQILEKIGECEKQVINNST